MWPEFKWQDQSPSKNAEKQTGILSTLRTFSNDIKMDFGLDKYAKATIQKSKIDY